MKNFYKKIITIALAILLTGCFPTERRSTLTNSYDFLKEAEKIDNFSISLSLPQNCSNELPQITTAAMRWHKDTILEVFQGNKTVTSEKEYDSDRYPQEKRIVIDFEDNSYVFFEPERLGFCDRKSNDDYYYQFFFSTYEVYYDRSNVSYTDELASFSKTDAIKRVKELAGNLGITHLAEPIVCGMTAESANNFFINEKQEHKVNYGDDNFKYTEWTKEDEAYFITFPLLYNGIPAETNVVSVPEHSYSGSYIKAIVTPNEVVYFSGEGITTSEYMIGKNIKINFVASDILKKIVSDYSQIVLSDKIEFYNCELTYAPVDKSDDKWALAPVWRFDYAVTSTAIGASGRFYEFYNAETGNKIAFEWQN